MAKKSMIAKNKKKNAKILSSAANRRSLSEKLKSGEIDKITKLTKTRYSSITRMKKICPISGRPRGYVGFFSISRTVLREVASEGLLPGLKKF